MTIRPIASLCAACCAATLLGAAAPAPSPEAAKALETQIRTSLAAMSGGLIPLPPRPVELTPDGDHYRLRVPFGSAGAVEPPDAAFTADLRPLGDTRWALDNQRMPSQFSVKTKEPPTPAPAAGPKDAKKPGPVPVPIPGTVDVVYRFSIGQQESSGTLDTSFATATSSAGTVSNLDLVKEGGAGASHTHIDQVTGQNSAQPTDATHSDILSDATGTGYAVTADAPDGTEVEVKIARGHIVSAMTGVARDKILPLLKTATTLGRLLRDGKPDNKDFTPEQRAELRTLLTTARGVMTGGKVDETLEGIEFTADTTKGRLDKAQITMAADAPGDTLSVTGGLSFDKLAVDTLPPPYADYLPTHFAIRPSFGNFDLAALTRIGLAMAAEPKTGAPPPSPDIASLYGKGGLRFGFDELDLQMAGVELTGTGSFTSPDPRTVKGQAELSARGLDALMTKLQADPALAQAAPALILLKGIGKASGDRIIWQVSVDNAKVLVNGVDLSAIAGGGSK